MRQAARAKVEKYIHLIFEGRGTCAIVQIKGSIIADDRYKTGRVECTGLSGQLLVNICGILGISLTRVYTDITLIHLQDRLSMMASA